MYLSASQSRCLSRLFGLLAEDRAEHEVRERVGLSLLELLGADQFASYVWDDAARRFGGRVMINMREDTLARYEAYYQFHDPITHVLQARRVPTLVTQVMPQRELMRTEFFNDFLARDGLHGGVNVYAWADGRNIGDLRIWRSRRRENFDVHALELLRLIEPAVTGALQRTRQRLNPDDACAGTAHAQPCEPSADLSPRELAVSHMVGQGLTDKQIAQRLGVELSTVRTYLERSFRKLGVQRRAAVAAAISRVLRG